MSGGRSAFNASLQASASSALMDQIYRRQRHIYDASRKFYLLGRDELLAGLSPPPGGSVLEIGCGTGRNLVKLAKAYPTALCHGLDVSSEMLGTAERAVGRARLGQRIRLAQADATSFDPVALFERASFDRIVISYALSMIPPGFAEARRVPAGPIVVLALLALIAARALRTLRATDRLGTNLG